MKNPAAQRRRQTETERRTDGPPASQDDDTCHSDAAGWQGGARPTSGPYTAHADAPLGHGRRGQSRSAHEALEVLVVLINGIERRRVSVAREPPPPRPPLLSPPAAPHHLTWMGEAAEGQPAADGESGRGGLKVHRGDDGCVARIGCSMFIYIYMIHY